MGIIKVKFASKWSLLTAFLLFLVIIAAPVIYYRTKYFQSNDETWKTILFPVLIVCAAIGIEMVIGYFTTTWHFENDGVKITSNRAWLFGKKELNFSFTEVESVEKKCVTNKFERLTIRFSNGKRLKLYHSIFSNKEEFRQLSRMLKRSTRVSG